MEGRRSTTAPMRNQFHCNRCGACCRNLPLFGPAYAWLDNGQGQCRYFEPRSSLCAVYALRPLICRVEEGYRLFFAHIDYGEYLRACREGCRRLGAKSCG